jgi:gp22
MDERLPVFSQLTQRQSHFFENKMNEIKEKALAKLLEELNQPHDAALDRVHNWICDQEDNELFEGILKERYSLKCALSFAKEKARKFAENGVACIDDATVFRWIREYFISNSQVSNVKQVPVESVKKKVEKPKNPPENKADAVKIKKEKGAVEKQMSIFDFLDE